MTVPEEQLALAKLLLAELSDFRFAIAGGVAVRLNGYGVEVDRDASNSEFGRIRATIPSGLQLKVELGRDWRELPTRGTQWGPVLHPPRTLLLRNVQPCGRVEKFATPLTLEQ